MTRGNHESNAFYNGKLRTQVQAMYGEETWQLVIDVLNELPIGIVLDKHILVMHAGIARPDLDIKSIRKIKKGAEPEDGSLLIDLLWADTTEDKGISVEANRGYLFGPDITEKFLQTNNLDLIVRGHSYTRFGYYKSHNDSVITIHSAPRMEEEEMHYGAFMNIYSADGKMHIEQFQSTTTPMMIDWRTL
jgi:serine/threonine-protein phosphatase 5